MSLFSSVANYGGRQPDNVQGIKQFVESSNGSAIWVYKKSPTGLKVIAPVDKTTPVYINSDLYVNGSIFNTSDRNLKENIETITEEKLSKFKNLLPKEFNYKETPEKKHYGFIAQEIEEIYPELVKNTNLGYKTVNLIEIIPLLVLKIQEMQKEIDILKEKIV